MSDLISRPAAIEAVMNTEPVFDSQSLEPFQKTKDVINALEELPSAQRWIPFRAEKPKGGQQILACSEDGVMWMTAYSALNNLTGAWMPLPEPWKGEDDERA